MSDFIQTGWWGIPGGPPSVTKVHAVTEGRPLCGTWTHPLAKFQWCARYVAWRYIDCDHCRAKLRRMHNTRKELRDYL